MASARPTASVVTWPKRCAPRMLNLKLTMGSPLRGIEARLRVDQVFALDDDALLDGEVALVLRRQGLDVAGRRAGVGDEPELELRRRAEDLLQPPRVLQARHLDEDAVRALALDVGLGRAQRVDAPAQHLDGLVDGLAHALVDAGLRDREHDQPFGLLGDLDGALPAALPKQAAHGRRELVQLGNQLLAFGGVGHANADAARLDVDAAGQRDLLLAQDAAHVVAQGVDLASASAPAVSTSSSTCEPPCRSSPSTMAWCGTSQRGMKPGSTARWPCASRARAGWAWRRAGRAR